MELNLSDRPMKKSHKWNSPWFYVFVSVFLLLWIPIFVGLAQINKAKYYLAGFGIFAAMVSVIVVGCFFEKYLTVGVCLILFFMSEFFEVSGTYIALNKCPKYTIPDDVFDVLPYSEYMPISFLKSVKSAALGDILMYVAVVPVAISLLFQKDNFRLLKRGFLLIAISSILRPITFNVTRLSDPNPDSLANREGFVPSPVTLPNIITFMIDYFIDLSHPHETSGDMIFSGHTRYLMVGLCVMSSLVSKKNWKVTVPCFVCELLCCCCAIYCFFLTRLHYTVDILLAIVLVVSWWQVLCAASQYSKVEAGDRLSLTTRLWISFLRWID
ncbi:hypothetical protein WA556_006115, partial [Blastocystis sp. ATCC 50177/Nand II]